MSIILDALRGGRAKSQTGPSPNTVQTDAVLHTLGYGRFNPATPGNRLKRALGLVVLAVILGAGLWVAVIWLTRTPPQPAPTETRPPVAVSPDAPAAPGTVAPSASVGSAPVVSNTPVTPNAPVAARSVAPDAPGNDRPSERADVPTAAPVAPSPAPTRPAGWMGPNASAVTAGEDHFGRARMYQRLGDFENALVGYRQVLLRDDLNVEAHNNLGVLYRDKGLFEDAIRHFERAIAINPGYARARNNLGVVYLGQRNFDLAATQFHAALAIDQKNLESMVNLSTVEREAGRRDHARAWLTRALDADGRNAEAHYNLGLMDDEAGARPQALGHYRAFLQYGAADHPALVGEVRKRIAELESKN
jgi:Tfp pilus assembly protein PilF